MLQPLSADWAGFEWIGSLASMAYGINGDTPRGRSEFQERRAARRTAEEDDLALTPFRRMERNEPIYGLTAVTIASCAASLKPLAVKARNLTSSSWPFSYNPPPRLRPRSTENPSTPKQPGRGVAENRALE